MSTPKEVCDEIAKLLLEGLTTDGAHHKQWYLAQALRVLTGDEFVEKAKQDFGFEEGTAA